MGGELVLTREEFASLAVAHRRAQLPKLLGIVPVPFAAFSAQGFLASWPTLDPWLAVGAGVVLGVVIFAALWRWEGQRLREWAMNCPNCGDWLLLAHALTRGETRTELITASGACPKCGVMLFVPPTPAR